MKSNYISIIESSNNTGIRHLAEYQKWFTCEWSLVGILVGYTASALLASQVISEVDQFLRLTCQTLELSMSLSSQALLNGVPWVSGKLLWKKVVIIFRPDWIMQPLTESKEPWSGVKSGFMQSKRTRVWSRLFPNVSSLVGYKVVEKKLGTCQS